tara:strand:+ start:4 stop:282 length:279 start_codon:yes stop_codon:yes gene_type:complete
MIQIREDLRDEETFIPVVLADEDKECWILTDDFFVECPDLEIPEKWQKEGCNLVIKKSSNDVPVKHVNIRNELQTLSNQSRIYYARTADFDW